MVRAVSRWRDGGKKVKIGDLSRGRDGAPLDPLGRRYLGETYRTRQGVQETQRARGTLHIQVRTSFCACHRSTVSHSKGILSQSLSRTERHARPCLTRPESLALGTASAPGGDG